LASAPGTAHGDCHRRSLPSVRALAVSRLDDRPALLRTLYCDADERIQLAAARRLDKTSSNVDAARLAFVEEIENPETLGCATAAFTRRSAGRRSCVSVTLSGCFSWR